jgi:hypothetical protein
MTMTDATKTYTIRRVCHTVETYTVAAPTMADAKAIFEAGESNMICDEVTDIYDLRVKDGERDVTDEWDDLEIEEG